MIRNILPYFRIFYLIVLAFILILYFAYQDIENLKHEPKQSLLTITDTFTSDPVLRSVWLWISNIVAIIYAGSAPDQFSAYFKRSKSYLSSLRPGYKYETRKRELAVKILRLSSFTWPLFLNAVIFMIDGNYPATESNIPNYMYLAHYAFLILMVSFFSLKISSFVYLIWITDEEMRKIHAFKAKAALFFTFAFACPSMVVCFLLDGIVGGAKDLFCVFEYLTVLVIIIFSIEVWSGFRVLQKRKTEKFERKMIGGLEVEDKKRKEDRLIRVVVKTLSCQSN